MIAIGAAAAIVGDNVGYVLGRKGAAPAARARPASVSSCCSAARAFFRRYGGKAVFIGRWVTGVRVVIAWSAGTSRLPVGPLLPLERRRRDLLVRVDRRWRTCSVPRPSGT